MRLNFAFARKVAVGLIAVGSLACFATDTFAANRTWTSSNINSYRAKWGTGFASNWAGNIVPTTADIATFGTNAFGQYALQVQPGTVVGGVRYNNTGANSYVFGTSTLGVGSFGINNQSGRQQTLGTTSLLADQTWSGGASASIVANNTDLNGVNLTTSTDVTLNTLNNTGGTSLVTVAGGNTVVAGGGPLATVNFSVTSGFLGTQNISGGSGFDSSASNLDVSGTGTYNNTIVSSVAGDTNWNLVTMSAGTIDTMGTGGNLVTNGYTQTGGLLKQYVGYDSGLGVLTNSSVQATDGAGAPTGPLSFGGSLDIDFAAAGAQAFAIGTTWNLFQGVNAGGAAASNFSIALLDNVDASSPYAGLSFSRYGTEWLTPKGTDGTYLVFQAQSGNLVVVPEPSTMVFAGLGVAMSGWTMWKKRRLSKLLAAKAG